MKEYEIVEIKKKTEEYDKLLKKKTQLDITHPVDKCVAQGILSTCILGFASYAAVISTGVVGENIRDIMDLLVAGNAIFGAGLFYDSIGALFRKAHMNRKSLKKLREISFLMGKEYDYKYDDPALENWRKFLFEYDWRNGYQTLDDYYTSSDDADHRSLGK